MAAARGRRVRLIERVDEHRHDRDQVVAAEHLLEDEPPAVRDAVVLPAAGRQYLCRARVEPGPADLVDQVQAKRGVPLSDLGPLRLVRDLGDREARRHRVELRLGVRLVPHGVAPVHGELRQQLVTVELLVVAADDHQDVDVRGADDLADLTDRGAAAGVALPLHAEVALGRERGAAELAELVEGVVAAAEGKGRVAAVGGGTLAPLLRGRAQLRAVRGPDAQGDLCQGLTPSGSVRGRWLRPAACAAGR
jgi:hypothetical protein